MPESNRPVSLTKAASRQLDLPGMEPSCGVEPHYPAYEAGASPSMLARQKLMERPVGFEPTTRSVAHFYSSAELRTHENLFPL